MDIIKVEMYIFMEKNYLTWRLGEEEKKKKKLIDIWRVAINVRFLNHHIYKINRHVAGGNFHLYYCLILK